MADLRRGVKKRCRYCGGFLDASTVRAARVQRDGVVAVIFRRSIPVLLCPTCDRRPEGASSRLWAPPVA